MFSTLKLMLKRKDRQLCGAAGVSWGRNKNNRSIDLQATKGVQYSSKPSLKYRPHTPLNFANFLINDANPIAENANVFVLAELVLIKVLGVYK